MSDGKGRRSAAGIALAAWALGELAVAATLLVAPELVARLLLGAPVADGGIVVARMAGVAIGAIGVGWWLDSAGLDARRLRAVAPGFIGYNGGAGLLLLAHAVADARTPATTTLVAVAHLIAAAACFAAARLRIDDTLPGEGSP
jgi:hypothetical protein